MSFRKKHFRNNGISLLLIGLLLFVSRATDVNGQDWQYEADRSAIEANQMLSRLAEQLRMKGLIDEQIKMRGAVKIKAGKANTRFVPSDEGFEYAIKFMKFDLEYPTSDKQINYLKQQVASFEQRMVKAGYSLNDNSDAANFAYRLSYEAYYNRALTGEDLKRSEATRLADRRMLLNHAYYQGVPDMDKQNMYIRDAVFANQAIEYREKATNARTARERQETEEKAKFYANFKLKVNNASSSNKSSQSPAVNATTTFERNRDLLLSQSQMVNRHIGIYASKFVDLMREFDQKVIAVRGSIKDAAWANAVAFALAYEVYTDGKVKLNDQQLRWVVNEMTKDVLADSNFHTLSNEEKQKYYETVALETMLIYDAYSNGVKKGFSQYFTKDQVIRSAKQRLNEIFAPRNIDQYDLTATGFAIRAA